jgi:galactonate dehydratase
MKITDINVLVVNAKMRNWIIVKVFTDVPGLIGLGEATLEFQTKPVVEAINNLGSLLIGQDPRNIEKNWQIMYRHLFFKSGIVTMSAISGIDQALWDIAAKDLGVPLWKLLGGLARERVRMYDHLGGGDSSIVYGDNSFSNFEDNIHKSLSDGFTAFKILAVPMTDIVGEQVSYDMAASLMERARLVAGPNVDIMVDFHGRTNAISAIRYAQIFKPYNPLFIEEVVQPEQIESLKLIRSKTNIPLATGERLVHRSEFLPLLQAGLLDVAQPDVCHAGGITEIKKISALCESFGVLMAPHNPLGPIATMVNVHIGLSTSNFLIQEVMRNDVPWREDVFEGIAEIREGYVYPPTEPGIGISLNEDLAKHYPFQNSQPVQWFNKDGSVADW